MNERWYRDVVELSQDAIYVLCDGCFVFANRATARLFGFESPENLIGRRVYDFIHPESTAPLSAPSTSVRMTLKSRQRSFPWHRRPD